MYCVKLSFCHYYPYTHIYYTCAVDLHLELIEVEPVPGLLWVQVVVEVPGCKPKTVEPQLRSQQQTRRALLIGHPGVAALPAPACVDWRKKMSKVETHRIELN